MRVQQEPPLEAPAGATAAESRSTQAQPAQDRARRRAPRSPSHSAPVGQHWWTVGRFIVSTDDAYVARHTTTLAAKVAGYVATVRVEDNTFVHAGDVVATLDDGDFRSPSTPRAARS